MDELPFVVVGFPGSGLATITDRRDRTTRLWSRTYRSGRSRHTRHGRHIACANCGGTIVGPFYRPSLALQGINPRLCLPCVEGQGTD